MVWVHRCHQSIHIYMVSPNRTPRPYLLPLRVHVSGPLPLLLLPSLLPGPFTYGCRSQRERHERCCNGLCARAFLSQAESSRMTFLAPLLPLQLRAQSTLRLSEDVLSGPLHLRRNKLGYMSGHADIRGLGGYKLGCQRPHLHHLSPNLHPDLGLHIPTYNPAQSFIGEAGRQASTES